MHRQNYFGCSYGNLGCPGTNIYICLCHQRINGNPLQMSSVRDGTSPIVLGLLMTNMLLYNAPSTQDHCSNATSLISQLYC